MARPRTISNEEILDVVRTILRDRGAAFTTAEVARGAGVSEGTIFKRFASKERLLLAALRGSVSSAGTMSFDDLVPEQTVQENLTQVTCRLIEMFRQLVPVVVAVAGTRGLLPRPPKCMHGPDSPHNRNVVALTDYLQGEMDVGRVRPGQPAVLARIITATTWNFVFQETVGGEVYPAVDGDIFARQLVDALWQGLCPAGDGHEEGI